MGTGVSGGVRRWVGSAELFRLSRWYVGAGLHVPGTVTGWGGGCLFLTGHSEGLLIGMSLSKGGDFF